MPALTKRFVDSLKTKEKEYAVWDSSLPGYGIRVYPTGRKGYCVQYRAGGQSKRMSLGLHAVVTPAQARQRAQEILSSVKLGGDPAAERTAAREAPTLEEFSKRYIADREAKTKARSVAEARKILRLHVLPMLGKRRVASIIRADAERLHNSLRATPFQANRALGLLQAMMAAAEKSELRPAGSNPGAGIERFHEPRRERFLTDAEFAALGRALRQHETENPGRRFVVAALKLILLTGARKHEILTARWEFVDWERAELRLPDHKTSRTKGAKSIALPAAALQLLEELKADSNGSPWVIQGKTPDVCQSDNIAKPWKEILKAAGITNLRIHDLRHSHASAAAGAGVSLPMVGALLGQSLASTTERYMHLDADPVHAASEVVGARIAAALDGKPEAEVIELPRRNS